MRKLVVHVRQAKQRAEFAGDFFSPVFTRTPLLGFEEHARATVVAVPVFSFGSEGFQQLLG